MIDRSVVSSYGLLVALALAFPPTSSALELSVELTTTLGETQSGVLADLDRTSVSLQSGSRLGQDSLATLVVVDPEDRTGPAIRVALRSGTVIAAQSIVGDEASLTVSPRRQPDLSIQLSDVRSIRFRRSSPTTDPKWLGLLSQEGRGDLIAVRREGDVIDSTRGVVLSMNETAVTIDLDGSVVPAPVEKLEGIVLGGRGDAELGNASSNGIVIEDAYDSRWVATSIKMNESKSAIVLNLLPGVQHELPLDQLRRVRWSGGSSLLASSVTAASEYGTSIGQPPSDKMNDLFRTWLGPRSTTENDLLIPGESAMEYRVTADAERLIGTVQRERDIFFGGEVSARIKLDDRVVWEEVLDGAEPLGFDLEIGDASRVRLEVDAMNDGDAGDLLRWIRPRLVK